MAELPTPGTAAERIADETELMARLLPLPGARLIELGCGKAEVARKLLARGMTGTILALEVDAIQHAANLQSPATPGLTFAEGGAQAIPAPDASFDAALMLKSLHHVPIPLMDQALREARRVLKPGGLLYVSEPVYDGAFNDILRLFHDEGKVRKAAYEALQRAAAAGVLQQVTELHWDMPSTFRDFDDFVDRIVRVTHSDIRMEGAVEVEVRRRFAPHQTPTGAHFLRPMRVNLMQRV